tara:strand:- start:514 stop:1692 length:1179 start_codon:yes stop_codon:yes gene_type:complete
MTSLLNIFKKNFSFRLLKKKDLLIFDYYSLRDLKKNINIKNYEILDYRNEINLVVVFIMIINLKFEKKFYFYFYLKSVQPKIIITTVDNNLAFYKLKDIFPNVKTILVQTAYQHNKYIDNFYQLKKNKKIKKYSVDYVFCLNEGFAKLYSKHLKVKKTFVIGSLRNNHPVKIKKNKKTIISYISQYRSHGKWNDIFHTFENKIILKRDFYDLEMKLIPIIANFCKKKKFLFRIIGSSTKDQKNEKNFYQNLIGYNNWKFLEKNNQDMQYLKDGGVKVNYTNSYKHILQSTVNIFAESTLGFESLARGIKTLSFFARKSLNNNKAYFGWPSQKKPRGFIWTNTVSEKEFYRLINNVLPLSKKNWDIYHNNKLKNIIAFDKDNKTLKNFLKNSL